MGKLELSSAAAIRSSRTLSKMGVKARSTSSRSGWGSKVRCRHVALACLRVRARVPGPSTKGGQRRVGTCVHALAIQHAARGARILVALPTTRARPWQEAIAVTSSASRLFGTPVRS